MKTDKEWLAECPEEMSGDLMQQVVGRETFTKAPTLEWIQKIQRDAYEQGRVDAMKWVSQECKRLTEHLATTQEYTVPKPLEFMPTGQVDVLPPVHPSWYKR